MCLEEFIIACIATMHISKNMIKRASIIIPKKKSYTKRQEKRISPGEDWTPDLRMSDTVYKYDALTNCATGECQLSFAIYHTC